MSPKQGQLHPARVDFFLLYPRRMFGGLREKIPSPQSNVLPLKFNKQFQT